MDIPFYPQMRECSSLGKTSPISDLDSIKVNGTWTGTCFYGCSAPCTGDFESDPSGNFKFSYTTCGGPVVAQGRIETSQDGQIIVKDVSPADINGELKTDTFSVKLASGSSPKVWTLIQCTSPIVTFFI
jgi:hypothetical protein